MHQNWVQDLRMLILSLGHYYKLESLEENKNHEQYFFSFEFLSLLIVQHYIIEE